jgi:hypothetical protein
VADGGGVVQQASVDAIQLARGPAAAGPAQLRGVVEQELQLLRQNEHQPMKRVEEESRVLKRLGADLMLGRVEGHPEQAAQLGPPGPRILQLGLGQGGAAPGAAPGQARARRVPGHLRVENEVIHPHRAV